jgi:hypothetical protein
MSGGLIAKIGHTFTRCSVCNCETLAWIVFYKDGKVCWDNKCGEHSGTLKTYKDFPEMPKDELDKHLRSLVL